MDQLSDQRILTLHPKGKKGVNILKTKYEYIKNFIVDVVQDRGQISYEALSDLAIEELSENFDGKVVWYIVVVKLDLEARGILERIPKTSPHELRLKE